MSPMGGFDLVETGDYPAENRDVWHGAANSADERLIRSEWKDSATSCDRNANGVRLR